jgi:hypothetical protein
MAGLTEKEQKSVINDHFLLVLSYKGPGFDSLKTGTSSTSTLLFLGLIPMSAKIGAIQTIRTELN